MDDNGTPSDLHSPVRRSKQRRRYLWQALLLGIVGTGGWCAWWILGVREPPTVDVAAADPEVGAAITAARSELFRAPRSPSAWGKLGKILAAHDYLPAARSCFIEAERLQSDEAHWPYFHGLMLAFSDNDAAIIQYEQALQRHGAVPTMRFRLAETLAAQGRTDEAEEQYRKLLDEPSLAARAELGLGRLACQRGDLDAARTRAQRTAADAGTQKAGHVLLAEIAQGANDPTTATRELAAAAKLPDDPEWTDPVLNEINREKVGKDARLTRARELSRQNRPREAAATFEELVKAYPDWDQGWLNYGRLFMDHRAYAPAERAFQQVLRLTPDSVTGHYHLGVALFQQDRWREAAAHFRESARLKADYGLAHYNLGQCLKRLDDRPGAIAAFREAVRCRPDLARAHTNLGELLAEQGDKPAAAAEARLSLVLNPDDEAARKLQDQLELPK
jgi:tetratricopeptide (TPR) repeat protein